MLGQPWDTDSFNNTMATLNIIKFMRNLKMQPTIQLFVEVMGDIIDQDIPCFVPDMYGHAVSRLGPYHQPRLNAIEVRLLAAEDCSSLPPW